MNRNPTTCPKCGGPAHWNTDDGVTYCDNSKWGYQDCEDLQYKPPVYRGGVSETGYQKGRKV